MIQPVLSTEYQLIKTPLKEIPVNYTFNYFLIREIALNIS